MLISHLPLVNKSRPLVVRRFIASQNKEMLYDKSLSRRSDVITAANDKYASETINCLRKYIVAAKLTTRTLLLYLLRVETTTIS